MIGGKYMTDTNDMLIANATGSSASVLVKEDA